MGIPATLPTQEELVSIDSPVSCSLLFSALWPLRSTFLSFLSSEVQKQFTCSNLKLVGVRGTVVLLLVHFKSRCGQGNTPEENRVKTESEMLAKRNILGLSALWLESNTRESSVKRGINARAGFFL